MNRFIIFMTIGLLLGFAVNAKPVETPKNYSYLRGVDAYQQQNYEDAADWFNKELSEHPDNGYAYGYLSLIHYYNGEYGQALSAIEKSIAKLPKKNAAWRSSSYQHRGNIHLALNDTVAALEDYSTAIKVNPQDPDAFSVRGELYYQMGNYAASNEDYLRITDLDPGMTLGYMGLGRNAVEQEKWADAIANFSKVIKMAPEFSQAYAFRAEAELAAEDWSAAADDIIRSLDIDGNRKAINLLSNIPVAGERAMLIKLKIQMTKNPTNILWPFYIGTLHNAKKRFAEAITFYKKANELDPGPYMLYRISDNYLQLGEYDKALDAIDQAIAMDENDDENIQQRANILSEMGRYEEALKDHDRYIERNPGIALGYLDRASDHLHLFQYEEAIDDYNTAFVIIPMLEDSPYFLMRRGDAERLSGRSEEAAADYRRLIEIEAASDSTLKDARWTPFAYSGLGDKDKTLQYIPIILQQDTTDLSGSLYDAACLYARIGQTEQAINYLREAFEKGYTDINHAKADYDFLPLHQLPEFHEIINTYSVKKISKCAAGAQPFDDTAEYTYETGEVPFTKEGGVTKVKCTINELPLHFVFDTGAAEVSISMVEANFMLKNDYISPKDVIGTSRFIDANGDISEGTVINLRNVDFGGFELENVRASVVRNQKAPLLLGQSVLGRLGKIEIDNTNQKLIITHKVRK